jgi:hypothetical protein
VAVVPDLRPERKETSNETDQRDRKRERRVVTLISFITVVLWLAEPSMNLGGPGIVAIIPLVLLFGRSAAAPARARARTNDAAARAAGC